VRINWFSPLLPARSSIAFDTAAVLPSLAKQAEVVLWTDQKSWAPELEDHAAVRSYAPNAIEIEWDEVGRADFTFYHIGNHTGYHGAIWRVSRERPGIVILHDLCLQHFFAGLVLSKDISPAEYLRMMEFHHGARGRELGAALLAQRTSAHQIAPQCPLTAAALQNASGVAVHTMVAHAELSRGIDIPIAYVPLFAHPSAESKADHGNRETYRLVMFGFIGFNRRLESVQKALHGLAARDRFHLHVYGAIEDEKTIRRTIDALALKRHVTLHGFVSDAELNAGLAASDLAINLREPTMGEASATQLRIWQAGLPSLVTNTGWYATLPENTVAVVRREAEIEDLARHLNAFVADPEVYRAIGRNGHAHVQQHHSIAAYVSGLLELAAATRASRGRESARWLAGRAGEALRPWFTGEAAGVLVPRVASAVRDLCRDP
jgi:glycosyltransferase involved in cell wall biosynthesis